MSPITRDRSPEIRPDKNASSEIIPRWFLPALILALLTAALRFPVLHVPLDRDEGGFAYIAWNWAKGALPYQTAFDNKAPLLYGFYRIAIRAFGANAEAVHLTLILIGFLSVFLFYRVARRWLKSSAAWAATAVFSLLAAEPMYGVGTTANGEAFAMLPILAAAWLLPVSGFLSGLCIGAAIMVKQTEILQAVAFAIGAAVIRPTAKERIQAVAYYVFGVTLLPAAWALYFWFCGAWHEFVEGVLLYNLQHTTGVATGGRLLDGLKELGGNLAALAPAEWGMWLLAGVGLTAVISGHSELKTQSSKIRIVFLMSWLVAACISLCVGFRFLSHYFLELAPVLALAAGFGWARLENRLPRAKAVLIGLAVATLASYGIANRGYLFGGSPETYSRQTYEGNAFVEAGRVAEFVSDHSQPDDSVFVFGSEPEILFLAQRRSVTRHIFFYPLTIERQGTLAYQQEVVRDVEKNPPQLIVWVDNPLSFLAGPKTERLILDKGRQWVSSGDYEKAFTLAAYTVYERKSEHGR